MQNFSLHTHTIGFDGKNTEEEMVMQAQNIGIKQLGFSNHFIVHNNIVNAPMYAYAKKGNYHTIYSSSFEEAIDKFLVHYQKIDELKKTSHNELSPKIWTLKKVPKIVLAIFGIIFYTITK